MTETFRFGQSDSFGDFETLFYSMKRTFFPRVDTHLPIRPVGHFRSFWQITSNSTRRTVSITLTTLSHWTTRTVSNASMDSSKRRFRLFRTPCRTFFNSARQIDSDAQMTSPYFGQSDNFVTSGSSSWTCINSFTNAIRLNALSAILRFRQSKVMISVVFNLQGFI